MHKNISAKHLVTEASHQNQTPDPTTSHQIDGAAVIKPETLRASVDLHRLGGGGGKIRSKKQWDAYQKLVAYFNQ